MKRLIAGGVIALAVSAGLAAITAAPAAATNKCDTVPLMSSSGWSTTAGGTVALTDSGVKLSTPVQDSAVEWKFTLPSAVKLSDVSGLSYQLQKLDGTGAGADAIPAGNDAALAAYRLFLDVDDNGSVDGSVVYEPYYNTVGNPARGVTSTWDVKAGKFWTGSSAIPGMVAEGGGGYANNKTLAQIMAANPEARVKAFSVGQGTYNNGAVSRVNHVKFASKRLCKVFDWKAPKVVPIPHWTVTPTPATCDVRSTSVKVVNDGKLPILVKFVPGPVRLLKPGEFKSVSFDQGAVAVFVNGKKVGFYQHVKPVCPTAAPTATPTATATPTPTPSATSTGSNGGAPGSTTGAPIPGSGGGDSDDELAFTGSTPLAVAGGGVALLFVGFGLLFLARRRRLATEA